MSDLRISTNEALVQKELSSSNALFADAYASAIDLTQRALSTMKEHPVETTCVGAGVALGAYAICKGKVSMGLAEKLGFAQTSELERTSVKALASSLAERETAGLSMLGTRNLLDSRSFRIGTSVLASAGALTLSGCGIQEAQERVEREAKARERRENQEIGHFVDLFKAEGPGGTLLTIAAGSDGRITKATLQATRARAEQLKLSDKQVSALNELISSWDTSPALQNLKACTSEQVFKPLNPLNSLDPFYQMNPANQIKPWNYSNEQKVQNYITAQSIAQGLTRNR